MLGELVDLFFKTAPDHIEVMQQAIREHDPVRLSHGAHTLKGSSGNFGAHHLEKLCGELEELVILNTMEGVPGLLARVETEFQRVSEALKAACRS